MKIGILREGKKPSDNRVVLTPDQAREVMVNYKGLEVVIQPSDDRCYSNSEYIGCGIELQEDLDDCNVLIGVKEVPTDELLEHKTYFFFSHTIKKQAYNRKLLQEVIRKNIRLIDYECITDDRGFRMIAFGRWAGIVGAYNGLYAWGKRSGSYELKRAVECRDYADLIRQVSDSKFPAIKIATTGSGRVAHGANELLTKAGIREVSPLEVLEHNFSEVVFANLKCEHLYQRTDKKFELEDFFDHPDQYRSIFRPYSKSIDLFINSIYWDPAAPAYFSKVEMGGSEFKIRVIADITCDIAPAASIPSTLRASTIDQPVYGYDPVRQGETVPFQSNGIDVMAVDNLPNELPRDASHSFGDQFLTSVMPELFGRENNVSDMLIRATIAENGDLTSNYEYLRDYINGQ